MIRKLFIAVLLIAITLVGATVLVVAGRPVDAAPVPEPLKTLSDVEAAVLSDLDVSSFPSVVANPLVGSASVASSTPVSRNVEAIGQIGGAVRAVDVSGALACVGVGPRLVILNIGDPARSTVVGQTALLPSVVEDVAVVGHYVYLADGNAGLRVIDASNPASPTEVGLYDASGRAREVAVVSHYAYVADDGDGGLRIIDVSNPNHPTEVAFYDTLEGVFSVAVADRYAYITHGASGLRIIDVSDPHRPSGVGSYDTPGQALDVAVAGHYAYIADDEGGLRIIDVSDPSRPTEAGFFEMPGETYYYGVAVAGDYAYVVDGSGSLRIIDVSNPVSPIPVSFYAMPGKAWDVVVVGYYAYVADGGSGLRIIDVSNPVSPTQISFYATLGDARDVAVTSHYAYVADYENGLRILDVSNPVNPIEVGLYDMRLEAQLVAVAGNTVYIASDRGPVRIFDVSNPVSPTQVGVYVEESGVYAMAVTDGYLYIVNGDYEVVIVDVSDPAHPAQVGLYKTVELYRGAVLSWDITVAGHYVYALAADVCIYIVDVSNPGSPTGVRFCDAPQHWPWSVAVAGHYAYAADSGVFGKGGLRIIDVSDPFSPAEISFYDLPGDAYHVTVAGHYAYVTDWNFDLRMVDVSDPARPTEVSLYKRPGITRNVEAAGNHVYIASVDSGLVILRYPIVVSAFDASPRSGPLPLTVQFTDQSSGNVTRWLWQFGDDITSTLQNPSHTYTTPGTYTVTLAVSGPDDSDTLTRTDVIHVNVPQPILSTPICGATNKVSPIFEGLALHGFTITLYDNGARLLTTTTTLSNTFALTPSLAPGQHVLTATATNSAETSLPSRPLTLTVSPTLPYDPVGVTLAYAIAGGTATAHPHDASGCANPDGWRVWLRPWYSTTVVVPVSYTSFAIVTITLGDQTRVVADLLDTLHMPLTAALAPPIRGGAFAITVTADEQTIAAAGSALIDPEGVVYEGKGTLFVPVPGVRVTCYYSDAAANEWAMWNAWAYDHQVNPQVTGADGYYSFFALPGTYRITASHLDYWPYTSPDLVVVDKPAHVNIALARTRRVYLPVILRR